MLAHANCLVLVLVGPTVAQGILCHGSNMLETLCCLALALPGVTMGPGIPCPGLAASLVGSIVLMAGMVFSVIVNILTVVIKFFSFLFLQEVVHDEGIKQQSLWRDLFICRY